RASAKISMRLVPNQQPAEIYASFSEAVKKLTPTGLVSSVHLWNTADPIVVDTSNRFVRAGVEALKATFGGEPVFVRSGGSVPVVALFTTVLKAPVVMMGFGLPDDGLHSLNEKFAVENFYGGIRAVADFLQRLAPK